MLTLITIIDDDPAYHYITKRHIQSSGYPNQLLQFYDGEEALNYFKEHCGQPDQLPDLVFLDIHMPFLDGWQFLDELSEVPLAKQDITIYIVTSSTSSLDLEKAKTYESLAGYHVKPITKEKFLEIVSNI